jgi:hypothetical protein
MEAKITKLSLLKENRKILNIVVMVEENIILKLYWKLLHLKTCI